MVEEPPPPRRERGAALNDLVREDLELYSAVDLEERIELMQDEISRTHKALDRKRAGRDAADAFFSLPPTRRRGQSGMIHRVLAQRLHGLPSMQGGA